MPEVRQTFDQAPGSAIVRDKDAALDLRSLITKVQAKPKGRKLRPTTRLCGCSSQKQGLECANPTQHDDRETEGEYAKRIASKRDIEVIVVCTPIDDMPRYGCAGRMWERGQTRCKVHADELEELQQEHGRIEVVTVAEMHSRVQVPAGVEDPVAYFEEQLAKARAAKEAAAKTKPAAEPEVTPEVAALPPGPKQDGKPAAKK